MSKISPEVRSLVSCRGCVLIGSELSELIEFPALVC